jgi:uncharacterized protein YdeI (YjbR/CyaY-like superfamily)
MRLCKTRLEDGGALSLGAFYTFAVRERYPMPEDIKTALDAANVMGEYEDRPAYQRNDYIGWITRAAKDETRKKRINQMVAELKLGGVYMKMSHPASAK